MAIRKDDSLEIDLQDIEQYKTKTDIRVFLLSQWSKETPQTKYRYFVEILPSNSRLYIERPGRLNKGCDFVIYIENEESLSYKNGNDSPPTHDFLLTDLREKKEILSNKQWESVISAIQKIYNVDTIYNALQCVKQLPNNRNGLPMETVFKLVRWFFIEQDLTYWAKSGREMLFNTIKEL